MSDRTVYVVMRQVGEYSDGVFTPVRVFLREEDAQVFVNALDEEMRVALQQLHQESGQKLTRQPWWRGTPEDRESWREKWLPIGAPLGGVEDARYSIEVAKMEDAP